jgi:CRISPR/Cas system-associated exonuclease Cas4 (RecB family)
MGDKQVMTDRMNAAGYYMPIELTDGIPLDFAKNMPRSRT